MLTVRIRPDLWAALNEQSQKSGHSLSQEVQLRLRRSIDAENRARHIRAFADAISEVAESIERKTEKSFIRDPWTGKALAQAINRLLIHFAAPGEAAVPAEVEKDASANPILAETCRNPAGFGELMATGFIYSIEWAPGSPRWPWEKVPNSYKVGSLPTLYRDLGSGSERHEAAHLKKLGFEKQGERWVKKEVDK
jgi:hypothetical protein